MTETEKILNLLEINADVPALVTDDESRIISNNQSWSERFGGKDVGKRFYKMFDKSIGLLIKNSFIDAKTFEKIQRRVVQFETKENLIDKNLLISPFKLESKVYYYILLYSGSPSEKLFIYPTLDDNSITVKYDEIIKQLNESIPSSLIEKKNIQFTLDSEKTSIAVRDKTHFLFTNNEFNRNYDIGKLTPKQISYSEIFNTNLLKKVKLAENELFLNKILFVIENVNYIPSTLINEGRIILFPILDTNNDVKCILNIGIIDKIAPSQNIIADAKNKNIKLDIINEDSINQSELPKIVYDKNNFEILYANLAASKLYGYEKKTFDKMNMTQLFLPEHMQKLLIPQEENRKYIINQITKDGSTIEVNVERDTITWENKEACMETIILNQPEEDVIELEEHSKDQGSSKNSLIDKIERKEKEPVSDFLSTLFHELLTPVNVILGFVQEIVDSIEKPTEEQDESAQIIKDNQQILLQAMNTAVQYAQLEEGKVNFNIDQFDINNYLVDLKDSLSRLSEKENVNIVFDDLPDSISIKHDRSKLLAAISYFIQFAIKLTDSSKLFITFKQIDNDFYCILKDSERGISENVGVDLLEILNNSSLSDKKNYGISPITIQLAKKLNDLLSVKVTEYTDSNDVKSIAFITSMIFEESISPKQKKSIVEKIEFIEDNTNIQQEEIIDEVNTFANSEYSLHDEKVTDNIIQIENGEVDEKIIEDIEDEEEIVTEEIATVETINVNIPDLSNYSCLFIDDNIDTQLLFKSQMNDFKLLKVCPNLSVALPLLRKFNFDLIIVDVNLNDTYNGFDALKIIRQFDDYTSIPIIAVTAYSFEGDKAKFINFGFTDYFVKPLLRNQLLKSIEAILQ